MSNWTDPQQRLALTPVINAAGTMTALGASSTSPAVVEAISAILPRFVFIDELQARASAAIAGATGAEAGVVTGCAAAGVAVSIAATITGPDPGAIERLPDRGNRPGTVAIQAGHLVNYGAPLDQAVRVAGARVRAVGQATDAAVYQLESALDDEVCAGLYVVSHHCVQRGQIPLGDFVASCHARGVPVVVDAAAEQDLRRFHREGADLVVYSAQKFLAGPTAGVIAGRKDLVRSCHLQARGIGRLMKPGKEAIVGTIAALEAWERKDHAAAWQAEEERVNLWIRALGGGELRLDRIADPTGNPVTRLRVAPGPGLGCSAWDVARELATGRPAIAVRDDGIDRGFFELDPCNLTHEDARLVADRILDVTARAREGKVARESHAAWRRAALKSAQQWPD